MFQIGEDATYHSVSYSIGILDYGCVFHFSINLCNFLCFVLVLLHVLWSSNQKDFCVARWVAVRKELTLAQTRHARAMKLIFCTSQLGMLFLDGFMVATL